MLVQKFGGTSLADLEAINASAAVVQSFADQEPVVVVLSALAGVTNQLEAAILAAESGSLSNQELPALAMERAVLEAARASGVALDLSETYFRAQSEFLLEKLQGVSLLRQCPVEVRAAILASGEGFSSRLMADLLSARGLRVRWSDTDVLPPANDDWLDTMIDQDAARQRMNNAFDGDLQVLVVPGFYTRNRKGACQLLGRNGSDYSAAALAVATDARCCQIWKEVDGFFSADPSVVPGAHCLDEVSFEEAMELSFYGARVISAKALAPLEAAGIPCEVRNTFNPQAPGTTIRHQVKAGRAVRGLSLLDGVSSLTLQGAGMRGRVGIARRVMDALAQQSISILLIVQSSSEYSITLCVRSADAGRALQALKEAFHFELLHGLIADISSQDERAVLSLVGAGMKRNRGIAARFLTAISAAGVNVEVIAQGSNECAIAVVLAHPEARSAMRACHTAFFSHSSQVDVILLGCGNVGSALLQQIAQQQQAESPAEGAVKINLRAVANSRQLLIGNDLIDAGQWQPALQAHGVAYEVDDIIAIRERLGLLNPTIVDCTTDAGLADQYTRFLGSGFNVVAANKKANTASMDYYHELRRRAAGSFRKFLYETNVGAGLPVIDTLHALMRSGDRLQRFEGVLSGSLSMIFGQLDDGLSFSGAVEKAMALGFTEPDPRDDLSGMDVARKLLIVAREVGMSLELADVEVASLVPEGFAEGVAAAQIPEALKALDAGFAEQVAEAKARGAVLRYIGRIEDGQCRVSVEAVTADHPIAAIRDGENALVLHTRYYQPIPLVLRGYGAGAEVTAAGVFADVLRTAWRPLDQ